jgi:CHAT domain-containing protein/tetratricopeptide (TPR) repeat protein
MRHIILICLTIFGLALVLMAYQNAAPIPNQILELEQIAEFEKSEGNFDRALKELQIAISEAEIIGLNQKKMDLLEQQLQIWASRDDLPIEAQLKGIEAYWRTPENQSPLFQKAYYDALTTFYFYIEEMDSMQHYYDKTMQIMQDQKLWQDIVGFNSFLAGEAYIYYADFFMAKDFIDEAEKVLKTKLLPKGEDSPDFYAVHAVVAQELGDYETALKSSLKSMDYLSQMDFIDTLDLIYEYNNLGAIYNYLEDFQNAEKYYSKALDLSLEINNPLELGVSYNNLGIVFFRKEDYSQAYLYNNKALQEFKRNDGDINLDKDLLSCYHQIIDFYIRKEQLDSAKYFLKKAEQIHVRTPYRKQLTHAQEGRIFLKERKIQEAFTAFSKALDIDIERYGEKHPNVAYNYWHLSTVFQESKEPVKALKYLQKGLNAISIGEMDILKYDNPSLDSVMDMDLMLQFLNGKIKALKNLHLQSPDSISLEDIYPTALLATEVLTRINQKVMNQKAKSFWLKKEAIPTYERAIQLALTLHEQTKDAKYLNDAFQLAERSKSVLLTEALQEQNAGAFGGVPDSLIQKEQRTNRLLAQMRKKRFDAYLQNNENLVKGYDEQIFQLEHEAEVLQRDLEANYPKYYELKYEDNVVSIKDIQSKLDENSIFLEYFYGNEQLILFQIQKDQAKSYSIDLKAENNVMDFQNLLANIQEAIKNPLPYYNNYIKTAHQYHKEWLAPALKNTDKERLIIIPDGPLGYIPFEALLTEAVEELKDEAISPDYAQLPYLVHKYRISYNYSGTLWLQQRDQSNQAINGKVLALAPSYSTNLELDSSLLAERSSKEQALRGGLLELPGAAAEIDFLSEKYQGSFFKDDLAAEKSIKEKAANYGILHLAMHGLVDEGNPEFSSLAMTEDGNPTEDNFFYAYEIKQLDLKASLVVLSACETGAGKYQRGEGVVSIGRGFMYAGAPSLLMTLWSLNDQSSLPLIKAFYHNLSEGMEKDQALQQAKLEYLKDAEYIAAHPALWACFIQLGNYDSISLEEKTLISSNYVWIFGGIGMILALGFVAKRSFKKRAA